MEKRKISNLESTNSPLGRDRCRLSHAHCGRIGSAEETKGLFICGSAESTNSEARMYSKSANYYDDIYAANGKDYPAEAAATHKIIQKYKQSKGKSLLDVGCGTGVHANLLSKHYQVEGLDIAPKMFSVARIISNPISARRYGQFQN
jgi:hypothetical protein